MKKENLSIGSWITLPSEAVAEILSSADFEWLVIDLEHTIIDLEKAEQLIRTIDLNGCKPLVRVSSHDGTQIKRVLDAGAKGIIAPMVETKEEGVKILEACYYPPIGKRGMGLARAHGYGETKKKKKYISADAKNIEVYFQIETIEAAKNISDIFSLPINGYFIGPYDLSASMGDPGNFESQEFIGVEKKIIKTAKKNNISAGYHLVEPDLAKLNALVDFGYNLIAYSVDIRMLDHQAKAPFKDNN